MPPSSNAGQITTLNSADDERHLSNGHFCTYNSRNHVLQSIIVYTYTQQVFLTSLALKKFFIIHLLLVI